MPIRQAIERALKNEDQDFAITTGNHPTNASRAYLGVEAKTAFLHESSWYIQSFLWINGLVLWLFILSLGLGLGNLLPLGPVDGGRMLQTAVTHFFGKKRGMTIWVHISIVIFFILLLLFFHPLIKAVLP